MFADAASPLELYDLRTDVGETTDVASDHPEVVARLDSLIQDSRVDSPQFPFAAR